MSPLTRSYATRRDRTRIQNTHPYTEQLPSRRICRFSNPMGMNSTAPALAYPLPPDYVDSVQGHSICFHLLTSHRRQTASRQGDGGVSHTTQWREDPRISKSLQGYLMEKGLDFKTLACAVAVLFTKHLLRFLIVSVPVNMVPVNRGWRYSPL